jgi:hypothetical protein
LPRCVPLVIGRSVAKIGSIAAQGIFEEVGAKQAEASGFELPTTQFNGKGCSTIAATMMRLGKVAGVVGLDSKPDEKELTVLAPGKQVAAEIEKRALPRKNCSSLATDGES